MSILTNYDFLLYLLGNFRILDLLNHLNEDRGRQKDIDMCVYVSILKFIYLNMYVDYL